MNIATLLWRIPTCLLPKSLRGGTIKPFMAKTSYAESLIIASCPKPFLCHLDFHDLSMFCNSESLILYSDLQLGRFDVSSGLNSRLRLYSLLFFCGTRKWGHGLTHGCGTEKHPPASPVRYLGLRFQGTDYFYILSGAIYLWFVPNLVVWLLMEMPWHTENFIFFSSPYCFILYQLFLPELLCWSPLDAGLLKPPSHSCLLVGFLK